MKAMAGVTNIGTDTNWCGHLFAQANWYAFGRLAWNPELSSDDIAREWIVQTFDADDVMVNDISRMMLDSHEAVVDYMMPLGLHHIFSFSGHYGPGPWQTMRGGRPDWQPPYYHRADSIGVGFNRTHSGSNAVAQYPEPLHRLYDDLQTCPEEYLLWFHHVPWTHPMKSGLTLWEELCRHYDRGVQQARRFQQIWDRQETKVDAERFAHVQAKLRIQTRDAVWWKDACLLYFQTFSRMPIPYDIERPIHSFDALQKVFLPIGNHENVPEEMLDKVR
jgi:alpha-glucuronidase